MAKLTDKQKRFVDEYIIDLNATSAAIRSGYSKKTAYSIGQRLLKKVEIQELIQNRMSEKEKNTIASQDEILSFLTSVMRGEVRDQIPLLSGDGYQSLTDLDETNPKDRIKAAELLGKRYALWTDKKEIEGTVGVVIIDDTGNDEDEE